ncbi:hypothetical protein LshimejAT787_0803230 [Lyophyllum shimeji]|uniref:F-box domain-containing protein n=1 Tax=Lyophyllum shimeji TaxID=47721 RepID=A0A9P3UPM6_LYOSH|nr:hypothetical protein LshimejAT787_0803230 [Lyophyllum shimeji]
MFLDLPVDIKLAIYAFLAPEDILALNQTCRGLHAFGCLDYVWHQVTIDLPLDLPLKRGIKSLTSAELQPIVVKALQLERNWRGHPGRPRKLHQMQSCDAIVNQMQPLGSEWLVTLLRLPTTFQLCIWSLKDDKCHRIAETPTALYFHAALQSEFKGTVAFIQFDGIEHLNIYSIHLPRKLGDKCSIRLCRGISRSKEHGRFFDVQVCGNLVAAGVARFPDPVSDPSYEMLLVNTTSDARWLFRPGMPSNIERLRFRVLPDRVMVIGVKQRSTLVTSIYALPPSILGRGDERTFTSGIEAEEAAVLTSHHESAPSPLGDDLHIPTSTTANSSWFPVIIFPDFFHQNRAGYVFNVPSGPLPAQLSPAMMTQAFRTRAKTSANVVCLGTTGRRAIWLQRRWDTDEFELMRGTFSRTEAPKVQPLLPKHVALPFETQSCLSLAFDEALGRVYVGLTTGGLYILEF